MAVVASEGFLGVLHPAPPANHTSFHLIMIRSKQHDPKSRSFPSTSSPSSSSSETPNFWPFSVSSPPVPSLVKAVHFTGTQSLSSISRQALLLLPELPYTLINEIKKRVPLPFLQEDGREEVRQDEFPAENPSAAADNSLGVEESMVFARCAWPRKDPSHLNQAMEASSSSSMNFTSTSVLAEMAVRNSSTRTLKRERQAVNMLEPQGPRCAWPREIKHGLTMQANGNSDQGEAVMQVIEGGAKCAWPRVTNGKTQSSSIRMMMTTSNSATNSASAQSSSSRMMNMPSSSSVDACAAAAEQQKKKKEAAAMVEGPRCAWPRVSSSSMVDPCDPSKSCSKSFYPPEDFQSRRMLATGIGVSMVNYYLLVALQSSGPSSPQCIICK